MLVVIGQYGELHKREFEKARDSKKRLCIHVPSKSGISFVTRLLSKPNKIVKLVLHNVALETNLRLHKAFLGPHCNVTIISGITDTTANVVFEHMRQADSKIKHLLNIKLSDVNVKHVLSNTDIQTLLFFSSSWQSRHDPRIDPSTEQLFLEHLEHSKITKFSIKYPSSLLMEAIIRSKITDLSVIMPSEYDDALSFCEQLGRSKVTCLSLTLDGEFAPWITGLDVNKLTTLRLEVSSRPYWKEPHTDINLMILPLLQRASSHVHTLDMGNFPLDKPTCCALANMTCEPTTTLRHLHLDSVNTEFIGTISVSSCQIKSVTLPPRPQYNRDRKLIQLNIKKRMRIQARYTLASSQYRVGIMSDLHQLPMEIIRHIATML